MIERLFDSSVQLAVVICCLAFRLLRWVLLSFGNELVEVWLLGEISVDGVEFLLCRSFGFLGGRGRGFGGHFMDRWAGICSCDRIIGLGFGGARGGGAICDVFQRMKEFGPEARKRSFLIRPVVLDRSIAFQSEHLPLGAVALL